MSQKMEREDNSAEVEAGTCQIQVPAPPFLCSPKVRSLWSSPVLCPQSLVIPCTVSTVSGHLYRALCSLWSSPVLCSQ
ncbi:unnamed protein product, partial [Staurois parvus]